MKHTYTQIEDKFLKDNVKGITLKELTRKFNNEFKTKVTESAIGNRKSKLNIRSGIVGGQFKKGQEPWNKGKKMSDEQYEKIRKTMFKKGNVPANKKEIGSERVDKKNNYIIIKVQDEENKEKWVGKHRYIYEQKYGKIPKGYKVIFADRNNRNFDLDNLVLVSNAEELIMNQRKLFSKKGEYTKTGVRIARILNKAKTK